MTTEKFIALQGHAVKKITAGVPSEA